LMVTLDPGHDTRSVLRKIVAERHLDTTRWKLARTSQGDVRKLSALLDIPYRKLENGDFNHASVLVLQDARANPVARSSQIGSIDAQFLAAIRTTLPPPSGVSAAR